ncbi:DMP19 family protein [Achromobacter sp. NCFB-sbj8-Ac1-l]|uniref:DMP19 family protein n=1 Tax=unclassified Achromobacter TaxID=2626865 RepID=UPI004046DD1D
MPDADYRIRDLSLTDTHVVLTLANGRTLHEPIRRHIRLEKGSPAERAQWQLVDDGHGVVWPALLAPSAEGMLNVRDLLWDAVYERALATLQAAGWQLDSLSPRDQELVALWRMEADINNGGFMQFLCNWGDPTCQLALGALKKIGAARTHAILADMRGLIDRFEESPEVVQLNDIYGAMTEDEQARLQELDEAYFEYPDNLARLGLAYYGAAAG